MKYMVTPLGKTKSVVSKTVVKSSPVSHVNKARYHREGPLEGVLSFILWMVGILISLAVGFGMADGTLHIPYVHFFITALAGWIVIIFVLLGVLLKIIDLLTRI